MFQIDDLLYLDIRGGVWLLFTERSMISNRKDFSRRFCINFPQWYPAPKKACAAFGAETLPPFPPGWSLGYVWYSGVSDGCRAKKIPRPLCLIVPFILVYILFFIYLCPQPLLTLLMNLFCMSSACPNKGLPCSPSMGRSAKPNAGSGAILICLFLGRFEYRPPLKISPLIYLLGLWPTRFLGRPLVWVKTAKYIPP